MDIFKGIGDFFGGLFGQKKKREDEQQPQQQQSAVSFNSAPKLGDNFANNLSSPTQPQQPKEFAKSSVDLNPVKPVQPVQPQPQMNREQEHQQLANKYRQEETDRYNQGSDHAANFLNDIFSGGKTAQMRENTINQNIQNRVNAEMLRKYGPDDQQVKQNIAQTSQNINKNATAMSDFTKNYNNNLQQTVSAPVSAVKGAANSVVEFVPRVSGAITELGANTIKLFDENNQFANNLIKRVRADREKNVVRKALNDATGLTDQDNKMAYGLGNSGARMAIDAAMTPVTGGIAPAVVHGVEAHSDMMDHLDNIEARKKAEAAAKGEVYTPSSFTSRYLASTANAGAQAAIEKLGIDNITGKIGGKFAKNMVGRAITGALGEAGEEGAQQYAENFTKKLFDNKQDIHENVAESALMGGIMGGAGKMAFGGMESVKNPYKSNTSYDPKALIEAERNAVRTGLFNKNNANSDLSLADKEFNIGAPERLAKALRNGADGDVSFIRMPNRLLGEVNTIRQEKGLSNINDNTVVAYKNAINNHLAKRIGEGMSPESSAHIAADSIINPYSNVYAGTKSKNGYNRDHIHLVAAPNGDKYNSSTVSEFNGGLSLKNIAPRDISEIKKSQAMLGAPLVGHKPEGIGISSGLGDIAAPQGVHTNNIAQNNQKVNAFNRQYEPEIQDLQNVYQKYGDDFEFNLTPEQQAAYERLLRESPRDSEGRYIDPATGEMTIDQTAQNAEGDLAETGQKTRKFAETVLDTDTPPKDFVKLMHAGDESLKYTPKKNSELWNKATKSVQESPERVFNELENTRVANDETMAKGIALAKHYQAMGDDLKASELYVELAKKATEAGRTVQALNLMRRTTPEGVLMSTMREVESYNDKMKNKPNKQINIAPEQRAEFLGKLREAYAMPEGDLKEIRARRIAIGEAIREVGDQIPSSKWDKFTTLWKAGLLTAPTTHIRNIAGNIINGGSEKVAQTVGSAFDWMISKGTGRYIIFYAILLIRR